MAVKAVSSHTLHPEYELGADDKDSFDRERDKTIKGPYDVCCPLSPRHATRSCNSTPVRLHAELVRRWLGQTVYSVSRHVD